MNIWHDISPKRITSDQFYAVIEISKGGKNKYELDKQTGLLKLDRVLFLSADVFIPPLHPLFCVAGLNAEQLLMILGLAFALTRPIQIGTCGNALVPRER